MRNKQALFVLLVALAILLLVVPIIAQDEGFETVAEGLVNPRNLSFDAEGNLYVAEAGNGGELISSFDDSAYGATGQVTMITPDGDTEVMATGFISWGTGGSRGPQDVLVTDDAIWVLQGEVNDPTIPLGTGLIGLSKDHGRVIEFVDLLTIELEEDPDGNPNEESNPTDMAPGPDGTVYIANAGCNCLMAWTPDDGVSIVAAWSHADDNPVPTAVDVDSMGDIYVGFLSGWPFPVEGARIEKWSGGELVETFQGLSAVTGIEVTDDGTIYAVETGINQEGPGGRLVMVTSDSVEEIVALDRPYGIVQGPDGMLYVTVGSRGGSGGGVVRVDTMMG